MNRFRTRRKNKETSDVPADSDAPPVPLFFKKGKKGQPEKKPEVDLATALPSSDDFRTSLLMPNLSARFSMLKEQDDPTSKIGKANDDSVLFPKRASRLNLFGNQLADISEVSSMNGSARPSLALARADSYASGEGYGTDDDSQSGSMMSRSRPGEGNNLFGGRQKVYKIPVGGSSSRTVSASEDSEGTTTEKSMGGGKFIYENDVAFSAFQKYREKEREKQRQLDLEITEQLQGVSHGDDEEASSPSVANYSRNRTTSSSTTSGPSNNRTSTAATSIDSQTRTSVHGPSFFNPPTSNNAATFTKPNPGLGVDRSQTKTRRLYGQGLEQAAQNQQTSALNRLESLSRNRAEINDPTLIGRSGSRSATSLNDRFRGMSPVYASNGFPGSSTSSLTSPGLRSPDSTVREGSVNSTGSNQGSTFTPPLSPPASEGEHAESLAAAVQPEDRGKATALGLFNKPAAKYDDNQFSRLQRQMHEGRNTPPLRRGSPAEPPPPPPAPESSTRPEELPSTTYSSTPEPVTEEKPDNDTSTTSEADKPTPQSAEGTFFTTMSDSESEDNETSELPRETPSAAQSREFDGLHPAFRNSSDAEESDNMTSDNRNPHIEVSDGKYSESWDLNTIEENEVVDSLPSPIEEEPSEKAPDSPTLGPSGLGLSGLVHTHLRRNSDRSSIYPPPSPAFPQRSGEDYPPLRSSIPPPSAYNQAASIHSNPWEYDDIDTSPPEDPNISAMSMKAKQILGQAAALKNQENPNNRGMGGENSHPEQHTNPTWQDDLQSKHHRGGSTETEKEREDFAKELAERRMKVQEKMRHFESNSRPNSPSVGHRAPEYSPVKPGNAFAMLKTNNGRDSLAGKQDMPQSKAMKMLGINNADMNSSAPNLGQNEHSRGDDERAHRDRLHHPGPGFSQNRQRGPRAQPTYRGSDDELRNYGMHESPSQTSFSSRRRDRSNSDVSRRSKTPNRYREDLQSVDESARPAHDNHAVDEHRMPRAPTSVPSSVPSSARPSVEVNDRHPSDRSASAASGRYRSNSRPLAPGYFDNKPSSIQTNNPAMVGLSPRPSPVAPYSANATPPLTEASPPGSGVSTPTLNPNAAANSAPRSAGLGAYKKAIDKSQISEPTFISCTSNVPTIGLPAGASLSNGSETPPIPPVNPRRRRQTGTRTIWGTVKGAEKQETPAPMPTPPADYVDEQSTFSDEGEKRSKPRHRLRKTSSEGGNLNAKARQHAMATSSSPAVPKFPPQVPAEGKMF
ncbi:hypothetical protein FQN54_008899 [Arachnomyces sp. PD_36]|nr:hypothetical protein FQN54_008899 [Arachnomyces sp. PD_36]